MRQSNPVCLDNKTNIKIMDRMLDYENQMFLDLLHEDGLIVTARGLGVERILLSFLKLHCDPENLVLVLNSSAKEEEYFIEQLENAGVSPLPKIITNEYSTNERRSIYMQGGVLFVTSRILVVDMLTERLPIDLVTGILVYRAHKIVESGQEAFIMRLYRQKNKTGFVKAFSDSPTAFTVGFCHVERVMKNLFVRRLYLWPRFHASVVSVMDDHKPDVVEVQLQLTPSMLACQTALLDIINACIKELKRCNPGIDTDEISVENAITKSFEQVIRLQLDPVWHQLGSKTRQLVADLKTLRLILKHLTQYDCVTFYNLVNSIRTNEKTFDQNAGWMWLESADSLFEHARNRVYTSKAQKNKKNKQDENDSNQSEQTSEDIVLEECPKWSALSDIMKEIEEENEQAGDLGPGRVLIAAEDDRTCSQIKEYLCCGGNALLTRLFNKSQALKNMAQNNTEDVSKGKGKGKGKTSSKAQSATDVALTLTQMIGKEDKEEQNQHEASPEGASTEMTLSSVDAYYGIIQSPVTIIHPLHGCSDPHALMKTLQEVQPRFVVLYDPDLVFVRQLEVFKASRPGIPLRVYFLIYAGSVEEQRYLTTLRKEKEAFELLIKEKATMVIPEERDGKFADDLSLSRESVSTATSTRKGGLVTEEYQKIIVDMREFRSELPSLIHRRGIDIEPVTLEVGDYILTPDICVERKSVSDLIGSLNSGRLYNQCVAMSRFYKRPVLLIEFDPNKPFSLEGKRLHISSEISIQDVTSRLALLTMHFPRLRILWCQSPYATADLFEQLKLGRHQPDAATAMTVTADADLEENTEKYSHAPKDFVLKLPGINSKNCHLILNKVNSLFELIQLTETELADLLGNKTLGSSVWQFLHSEHKRTDTAVSNKQANTKILKSNKPSKGFKRKR